MYNTHTEVIIMSIRGWRYLEYSLELEKEKYPDWDTEELYLLARKNFNISALDFFAETLRTLTTLRPKVCFRTVIRILLLDSRYCQAKWGFYGLPMNFNGPCDGNGTVSLSQRLPNSLLCMLVFPQSTVCGYDSGVGKLYRRFSDEQNLVWESSTALYPRCS